MSNPLLLPMKGVVAEGKLQPIMHLYTQDPLIHYTPAMHANF